jgi:hypothetical protein
LDSLIDYSLKKTAALETALSAIEDKFNLNSVSLTDQDDRQQSTGLYTFEGQEYKDDTPMATTNMEFIDIGQRERKHITYDIDKYYRDALTTGGGQNSGQPPKEKKKLKGWRLTANGGYDHQFFDIAKLDALEAKETLWNGYALAAD